jgi:hypothetical protein
MSNYYLSFYEALKITECLNADTYPIISKESALLSYNILKNDTVLDSTAGVI